MLLYFIHFIFYPTFSTFWMDIRLIMVPSTSPRAHPSPKKNGDQPQLGLNIERDIGNLPPRNPT